MIQTFASDDGSAIPLDLVTTDSFETYAATLTDRDRQWLDLQGYKGGLGKVILLPGDAGDIARAVAGLGSRSDAERGRFLLAKAAGQLPAGAYRIDANPAKAPLAEAALGWLLESYSFGHYKDATQMRARLVAPDGVDAGRIEAIAAGEALTRDLINTPASDMGPAELEAAAIDLAREFDARLAVTPTGDLLAENLPLIHTVGRAAAPHRGPRLLDMRWGKTGPKLTLVGKGVCFDTGGLNLKPGASMALMKKDMGGAATVLGLARMIMSLDLPIRLRVLIPAVENSVSGDAFRPGDILRARNGLTVEINNTDAEGRLVLADALALGAEEDSDLTVSMATLTGAARVAVGPDLAPFFASSDEDAARLSVSADRVADPVWRLPFHAPYESQIEPGIADLDNAPSGGMAGAITAALFLRRFAAPRYVHFDIYGWQPSAAPGRPKGGVGQGARALLDALPDLLGL
jgi:leucyl aminopeptidase